MKIALVAKFCIGTLGKVSHQSSILYHKENAPRNARKCIYLKVWSIAIDLLTIFNCNLKWKLHHFCISSIDQKGSFLFLSIFLITDLDPRNDLAWFFIKIKWVLLSNSFKVPFSWWQVFLSPFLNPKIQSSSLVCFICHVTAGQIANMRKTQKLLTDWIIKCYLFVPPIKRN